MLEKIVLPHLPKSLTIHATLYQDIKNLPSLKNELLQGNKDFQYAFIDASLVLSRTHVLAATFRACDDFLSDRMKSHNVHSEIVFCLSSNNNIGEAFRKFGIGEHTKDLVVIKVLTTSIGEGGEAEGEGETDQVRKVENHLRENVQGEQKEFSDEILMKIRDLGRIRKGYKIPAPPVPKSGKVKIVDGDKDGEVEVNGRLGVDEGKELETQVLGLMALRGAN